MACVNEVYQIFHLLENKDCVRCIDFIDSLTQRMEAVTFFPTPNHLKNIILFKEWKQSHSPSPP